ncbi:hypothetical protein AQUCO_01000494v1 [Aquilegia coerulea]|uniref:Neurochondrin n=1 Tax=Aquilegia coerulea TaxID=218851 RepID=A0A2G5EAB7_AQUCA|nr:hypothetical protein AQUCO_01000494v1 [Aquilegia coerulea]
MEECLKLLKGQRDEQRLAGLLLATKFCKGDDHTSIFIRVYEAIGAQFLDRDLVIDECYEFLFLVSTSSDDGLAALYNFKGISVFALDMSRLCDGSHPLELAMRLVQLMLSKLPLERIYNEYATELSQMVVTIARQFALSHSGVKFEALYILSTLLSSKYAAPLHDALRLMSKEFWSTYLCVGIAAVLQNRVASREKMHALILAESMMSILGEEWLIDQSNLPGEKEPFPVDRCLLLVLESARVEVAVLLNELAYLKYAAPEKSSAADITLKPQNLSIVFSLIEKIIKLISNVSGGQGKCIDMNTIMKVITGLDETIGVVLDFLQDAKEHGQRNGDDLLASVRLVGSYLAESPFALKEKVQDLLEDILLIGGEDEPSPFYSLCFMLPFLCQITMEVEGCRILARNEELKPVVDCLVKLIVPNSFADAKEYGIILLACDTIMNVLLKKEETSVELDDSSVVRLLTAFSCWTEFVTEPSVTMMASSICSLIFESTSEEVLFTHPDFELRTMNNLSQLITRSLTAYYTEAEGGLYEIVTAGYTRWAHRFPHINEVVKRKNR